MPRNFAIPLRLPDLVIKSPDLVKYLQKISVNPSNVDQKIWEQYLKIGHQTVISTKVINQFSLFFRHTTFCKYPRRPWVYDTIGRLPWFKNLVAPYSYTEHLHQFTSPLLAVAGAQDHLGPPADVRYVTNHVGSTDVTYLELSQQNGFSADYGHLDLNLGLHVRDEVYPRIARWLHERSQP